MTMLVSPKNPSYLEHIVRVIEIPRVTPRSFHERPECRIPLATLVAVVKNVEIHLGVVQGIGEDVPGTHFKNKNQKRT